MSEMPKKILHKGILKHEIENKQKLEQLRKEGWVVNRITAREYQFRAADPADEIYLLDVHMNDKDEQEYLQDMEQAGWTLAAAREEYHLFTAKPGTPPKYSDSFREVKQYDAIRRTNMGIALICSGGVLLLAIILLFWPQYFRTSFGFVYLLAGALILFFFVISMLESLNQERRIKRIKER